MHSEGFPAVPSIHSHHHGLSGLLSVFSDFLSVQKSIRKEEAEIALVLVTVFALISGQRIIKGRARSGKHDSLRETIFAWTVRFHNLKHMKHFQDLHAHNYSFQCHVVTLEGTGVRTISSRFLLMMFVKSAIPVMATRGQQCQPHNTYAYYTGLPSFLVSGSAGV